jgi:hypothetical protein
MGPGLWVLAAAALGLAGLTAANGWLSLTEYAWAHHHSAGAWTGLASDFLHGDFYRPLVGPLGYGGTRYLPLFPALTAAAGGLGSWDLYLAGVALSLAATALFVAGLARLLVRLGTPAAPAALLAACGLAAMAAQQCAAFPRGDMLAAALNLWGLAWLAGPPPGPRRAAAAGLLFALAFTAKFTTVHGLAAGLVVLAASRRWGAAAAMAATAAAGMAAAVGLAEWASQGRFLEVLLHSAGGGFSWQGLLGAPVRLVERTAADDPGALLFLPLGLAASLALAARRRGPVLVPVAFGLALGAAVIIFADYEVQTHHLLDLQALSVAAAGSLVWSWRRGARRWGLAAIGVAVLVVLPLAARQLHWSLDPAGPRVAALRAAVRQAPAGGRLLATNAAYPVILGQRPFMVDYFMYTKLIRARPSAREPLFRAVAGRRFGLALLYDDYATPGGRAAMDRYLGEGFAALLRHAYPRRQRLGRHAYLYLPPAAGGRR